MSTFVQTVPVLSATAGHLPPQSVNAAATAAPSTGGWVKGDKILQARKVVAFVQTGAFTSTPSMAFKLQSASDANGTGAADVTGGAIATIAAANTAGGAELAHSLFAATSYYAIACTATGGTSGLVAGQLRLLDPGQAG